MVVHDSDQQQRWTEQQQQIRQRKPEKKKRSSLSVTAVQSLACCCLILVALLFRLVGGEGYEQLRHSFHKAMQDNAWASVLADWLENGAEEENSVLETDGKVSGFTGALTLITQGVSTECDVGNHA